ncbi:MAG: hypothetical protein LBO67_03540 [Spirochaetaceae bacterium]|nr:hypothetical protein [Spirochaetaceae bacterium]
MRKSKLRYSFQRRVQNNTPFSLESIAERRISKGIKGGSLDEREKAV